MRTPAGLLVATALLLVAGCTGGGGAPTTPSPPAPVTATAPSGTPTSLVPGADCLTGTWRLVRFVGIGEQSTYGTGQGGDVTVAFDNGRYTMVGGGQQPITVNLAGSAASLTVDGTAKGSYQPDGTEMGFTVDETTGQGTLEAGGQQQSLPMAQIGQVIAPSGKATLACPQGVLLIALPTVRLELER